MLLRLNPIRPRGFLAEMKKFPNPITKISQLPVSPRGQIGFFLEPIHIYIVSRYKWPHTKQPAKLAISMCPRACYDTIRMRSLPTRCMVLGIASLFIGSGVVTRSQNTVTQTERIPQFENEDVKVWKSVVMPNAPLTMHRHEHPRVIIALRGGTMKIVEQNGASEQHVWDTAKAYWLPANPPNTMHADVNAGDKPIEVMVVELKHEK